MTTTTTKAPWVEKLEKARDIAKTAESAARELTDDERKNISNLFAEAQGEKAKATEQAKTRRDLEQVGELLKAEEAGELNEQALNGAQPGREARRGAKSLGAQFARSDEFAELKGRFPNGFSEKAGINMSPVNLGMGTKALLTSSGQTEGDVSTLIEPQKLGLVDYPYVAPTFQTLVTNGTTTSDRIEYAQVIPTLDPSGKTVNAAAGVKESPATTGTVGVKPESALAFRKASADVITIANWIPVTKKALSDAAQISTMIDNFLQRNLVEEVERQMLVGDKDAPTKGEEEFEGLFNTNGVQNQAFDTDILTTMRRAIGKVGRIGGQVTGVLVSPELDEELDLLTDKNGRYFGQGPWGVGPNTIWGRPRVVVPSLSGKGKFVVGDLTTCILWDREQSTVTATDSHADFFVRNMVAILAELRAGFGILNPSLLVTGPETKDNTPVGGE